jgi:2-dehydro-3-deoxyphosphogluconate aldolase/(4S)-4-hydroxy-2-oxoglutarate aldolase
LPQLTFCPTGGITLASAPNYLKLRNVICVGGSWMLSKQAIAAKNWPEIQKLAATAAALQR